MISISQRPLNRVYILNIYPVLFCAEFHDPLYLADYRQGSKKFNYAKESSPVSLRFAKDFFESLVRNGFKKKRKEMIKN